MYDLFKAELKRFCLWAGAYAFVQLLVLLFLTRVVDLAQQPWEVYLVIASVHALAGLLLGLYQFGGYRRPNAWLNLLHRPLAHWRIALALHGAGALLLLVAVLAPLLLTAAWQETMTARVLDHRHLLLCLAAWSISLIAYLSGSCAMLLPRRVAAAPLVFLALLPGAYATGVGALALQLLVLGWLLALMIVAFKPDIGSPPRGTAGLLLALPMQLTMWLLLVLAGFGVELLWIAQGSHPNNLAQAPVGSAKEADMADGDDLIIAGLASSKLADAPLWREQAAISDIATFGLAITETPIWNELTNRAPMEFDDEERRIRWVFSHDRGRFVGYRLTDRKAVAELGVDGDGRFASPPLPGPRRMLIGRDTLYEYDSQSQRVLPRLRLPAGEVIAGLEFFGERLAVLGDRALYVYDARALTLDTSLLATRQRLPLPAAAGNLQRVDVMELLDGHLVSFTMTRMRHNGEGPSFQQLVRIDEQGRITDVARRELATGYGPAWIWQTWYLSPVIHAVLPAARALFSPYQPGHTRSPPPRPPMVPAIAGALLLLSLLAALLHVRRTALSLPERLAWSLACAVVGLPALMALRLIVPPRETLPPLATAQNSPA